MLVVEITPKGETTLRVEGVHGSACVPLARMWAALLGEPAEAENTWEYYLNAQQEAALELEQGPNDDDY